MLLIFSPVIASLNSMFGADEYDRLFSGMRIGPVYNGTFVCGYLAAEEIMMLHRHLLRSLVSRFGQKVLYWREVHAALEISDVRALFRKFSK
jgi:hypothetical protein